MLRSLFCFAAIFFHLQNSTGQSEQISDSLLEKRQQQLDSTVYDALFTKAFTKLASGQSLSNLGQYASISTTDNVLTASIFIKRKIDFSKLTIRGGTKNGITSLLSKGEFNKSIGLGYDFYFLLKKPEYARDATQLTFSERELELNYKAYETLRLKGIVIQDSITILEKHIEDIQIEIKRFQDNKEVVNNLEAQLSKIQGKLNRLEGESTDNSMAREKNRLNDTAIFAKAEKTAIFIKNVEYISLGASVEFNDVLLFDKTLSDANQLRTEDYENTVLQLNYTRINQVEKKLGSFEMKNLEYFTFGVYGNIGSNLSSLEKVTVRDTDSITPNREAFVDRVGFVGSFEKQLFSGGVSAEYLKLYSTIGSVGLHLKVNYLITEKEKPRTILQVGAVFPFLNSKDASLVNIEVFYQNNDLFQVFPNNSLARKSIIGLQTTFPLNF